MEIYKKKETKWMVKKKESNISFLLKSIENAGRIEEINIGFEDNNGEHLIKMDGNEFKKFFAILKSFNDLLYSEGLEIDEKGLETLNKIEKPKDIIKGKENDMENRTEEEINNIRKIEKTGINNSKIKNIEVENLSGNEAISNDILNSIDEIEPTVEETESFLQKSNISTINNLLEQKKDTEDKDSNDEKKNEKEQNLDSSDWDPW